ncbi:MAG: ATP synthase F0 subunit B [Deltaproteobacteria bacterium]
MFRIASYFFLFMLTTSVSFAEEAHKSQFMDMTYRFINFAILLIVLYKVAAKPLRDFIASRSEGIRKALDEARLAREEAEKRYKEYQEKMGKLTDEAKTLKDSIVEEGNKEKARIVEEANTAALRIKEQAQFLAEQEIKKARQVIKEETANLIVEMTEEKLKREIKGFDQEKLIMEYLSASGGIH